MLGYTNRTIKETNIYMSKKARDIKKHYRRANRQMREFNLDLSDDSWYNFWHTHLDWDGLTNKSQKHRKIHIQYYLDLLDKIERLTIHSERDFQTWIFIDGKEGMYDALFFHTKNMHSDFPFSLDNINWNAEIPDYFATIIDLSKYSFGRAEEQDGYHYIIQRKGLGRSI